MQIPIFRRNSPVLCFSLFVLGGDSFLLSASCVNILKAIEPRTVPSEFYDNRVGMPGEFASDVDQILQDRTQSTTRHFNFNRQRIFARQRLLPDITQTVVCQCRQVQNKRIGRKFSARQTFNSHVRFELAVKLFAGRMSTIQLNANGFIFR